MNCSTCGDVEHRPIPEDEAHCDCDNGWTDQGGRCQCRCHDENCDGFSPTCKGPHVHKFYVPDTDDRQHVACAWCSAEWVRSN